MSHSPFINNAATLMPFIKCLASNIKLSLLVSRRGNWRQHNEIEFLRREKSRKGEFIAQTVIYGSPMKALINGILIPIKCSFSVLQETRNFFKASSVSLAAGCTPLVYYTSAHIRLPHIDGSVMTRTCRIRPGPAQRSRANQSSSIIRAECENLRDTLTWKEITHTQAGTHTHAQRRNCWGGWLLGHRCSDGGRK